MKRESLSGKLQANIKWSSNSWKNTQKCLSIEVVRQFETSGERLKCYSLVCNFQLFNNFWGYLCCTSTCLFHAKLSSLAKKQLVCNHIITARLTTWVFFIIIIFQTFFIWDIVKPCFLKVQTRKRPEDNFSLTVICVFNSVDEKNNIRKTGLQV